MTSHNAEKMNYPHVRQEIKNISFEHGANIVDAYNWLENIASPEVKEFEKVQNAFTFDYLQQCHDIKAIKNKLKSMASFRKMSCPTDNPETGDLYFFINDEDNNHDSLYRQAGMKGKPELFLSTKQIPSSSRNPAICHKFVLRMYSVSPNGKIVAYAYSLKYSNWLYIRFKEVETGKHYPEVLKNVCHSDISWTREHRSGILGIVYSCFLNPDELLDHKIVFHELGTPQDTDVIFVEFPVYSEITMQAQISDCGDMIFVTAQEDNFIHFFYGDLGPTIDNGYGISPLLFHLLEGEHLDVQYITNHNYITYFRTNLRAANFRIVKTNLLHNDVMTQGIWETVIPTDLRRLLDWAVCVNRHYLMVCYVEDACHSLQLHTLESGQLLHKYSLPIGTITEYHGFRHCSKETCCGPLVRYMYTKIRTFNDDLKGHFAELSEYRVRHHYCVNPHDGIAVPMFLIHRKRIKRDGSTPCIIYGQGCFGVQVMPCFSISKLCFLQCFDGMIAVVGVRGGGEYGAKWYVGGNKLKKQTTYDDFIAASEYLIKKKFTSPSKLIIEGQFFGGNLAAACLTQRPDLYGAVIIHEGLLDLLRHNVFPMSEPYIDEFGDPESPIYFEKLRNISPLQHVRNENTLLNTPAVMLVIGGQPSLAHPSNSFKFIAEMQHSLASKSTQHNPFLLCSKGWDELSDQVHGRLRKIEERTYIYSFLIQSLDLKFTTEVKKRSLFKRSQSSFKEIQSVVP